jgi:acetyl-CoA synthetase
VVYGPLLHGATEIMYEGVPDYPDTSRIWDIIDRYGVTIFYTTPTALRMFMKFGNAIPNSFKLSSLRLLGTVGEPINPEVWIWYFKTIGKSKCPIIDTWWQTETGGMILSPLPGLETISLKPGSATRAIPGIDITVVDERGNELPPDTKGYLVIRKPWPGMLLTLWGDDEKYKNVYWSKFENCYYPGDYATKDHDGYFWLLGRADDILKVAGHRIGTAELESSLVSHRDIAEAAVCGIPDEIKGEVIVAFTVLKDNAKNEPSLLRKELMEIVRNGIGPIATPQQICFVTKLPKTRSGKIMRRVLKAIASNENVGDISTLEDSAAVMDVQNAFTELQNAIRKNKS